MGTVIGVFNVVLIRLPGEYFSAIGGPLTAFVLLVSLPGFNRELSAHCPTIAGLSTPIISTSLGSSGVRARGILALIGICWISKHELRHIPPAELYTPLCRMDFIYWS